MYKRQVALELLSKHLKTRSMLKHSFSVEGAMIGYAKHFGEDVEKWGTCGLLHDIDFEEYPETHPRKGAELLTSLGYAPDFVEAILGHSDETGVPRQSKLAKVLYAVDELSGFIIAAALVRPTRFDGLEASSIKKKMKDKAFAKAVNREHLKAGAEDLGMDFTDHVTLVIQALQEKERVLNAEGNSLLE